MNLSNIKSDVLKALNYLGTVDVEKAKEAFQKPSLAGVLTAIKDVDTVAKIVGIIVPPVAIAADDAEAIINGVQFLMSISSSLSKIPQTTLDTENYIEDRFQNPRY